MFHSLYDSGLLRKSYFVSLNCFFMKKKKFHLDNAACFHFCIGCQLVYVILINNDASLIKKETLRMFQLMFVWNKFPQYSLLKGYIMYNELI